MDRATIETQLRAIRYLQAGVSLVYGRVPWRILPEPVRSALLKRRLDPALLDLVNQVFDAVPGSLGEASGHPAPSSQAAPSNPSQAA